MIRLFLYVLVRFFISVLAIYFALTLLKKVIRFFQGTPRPSPPRRQEKPPRPKEEYKDVQDAKFTELPKPPTEDSSR
jgi:hypothetical protein